MNLFKPDTVIWLFCSSVSYEKISKRQKSSFSINSYFNISIFYS